MLLLLYFVFLGLSRCQNQQSFLEFPRLHLSGYYYESAATLNNYVENYNKDNIFPSSPLIVHSTDGGYYKNWNPAGSMGTSLQQVNLTKVVTGPSDGVITNTNNFRIQLVSNVGEPPARGIDMDVCDQMGSTEIWGLKLALLYTDDTRSEFLLKPSDYIPATLNDLTCRQNNGTSIMHNKFSSGFFQSVIKSEGNWDVGILEELRSSGTNDAALAAVLDTLDLLRSFDSLSIRVTTYGFHDDTTRPDFGLAKALIAIGGGPHLTKEVPTLTQVAPASVVLASNCTENLDQLSTDDQTACSPPGTIRAIKHEKFPHCVTLDFSNTIPMTSYTESDFLVPWDVGTITVNLNHKQLMQLPFTSEGYAGEAFYNVESGLVTACLSSGTIDLSQLEVKLGNYSRCSVQQNTFKARSLVAIPMLTSNNLRLSYGENVTVTVQVYNNEGTAASGAYVSVLRSAYPYIDGADGCDGGHYPHIKTNYPECGLLLATLQDNSTMTTSNLLNLKTDNNGQITFMIHAGDILVHDNGIPLRRPRCFNFPNSSLPNPFNCMNTQMYWLNLAAHNTPYQQTPDSSTSWAGATFNVLRINNLGRPPPPPNCSCRNRTTWYQPDKQCRGCSVSWWDIQPLFQQYKDLFPIMNTNIDLGSYNWVVGNRRLLQYGMKSLPREHPLYMPLRRDLSTWDTDMILQWLGTDSDANGEGGKPKIAGVPERVHRIQSYGEDVLLEVTKQALQCALQLELSTIPPYLTAAWSIKNGFNTKAKKLILSVADEEMLHFTIVANVLLSIGGKPRLDLYQYLPSYPSGLPCGCRPDLVVPIGPYSKDALVDVFMAIEQPGSTTPDLQFSPQGTHNNTIGDFYDFITECLTTLDSIMTQPLFNKTNHQILPQQYWWNGMIQPIQSLKDATDAIAVIKSEGEGAQEGADVVAGMAVSEDNEFNAHQWVTSRFPDGCPVVISSTKNTVLNGYYVVTGTGSRPSYSNVGNTTDNSFLLGTPPTKMNIGAKNSNRKFSVFWGGLEDKWVVAELHTKHDKIHASTTYAYLDTTGVEQSYPRRDVDLGTNDILTTRGVWKVRVEDGDKVHFHPDEGFFVQSGCELAHYYKFKQLYVERELVSNNGTWKFNGLHIPYTKKGIHKMRTNSKMKDFEGPNQPEGMWKVAKVMRAFNEAYTKTLYSLQLAFNNESTIENAIGMMMSLQSKAYDIVNTPIPGTDGEVASPSWEPIPIPGFDLGYGDAFVTPLNGTVEDDRCDTHCDQGLCKQKKDEAPDQCRQQGGSCPVT